MCDPDTRKHDDNEPEEGVHALTLLRRRLQGLFGPTFQLEVRSEIGEGTTVTMRIPLQTGFEAVRRSSETMAPAIGQVAPS